MILFLLNQLRGDKMILKINLEFFNNHDFQKKVIINFINYMDLMKEATEISLVKTIHEESEHYYELQPLLNNIKNLQNHFIKELFLLVDSYEEYFSEFSFDIDYKDKIKLYENLTEAKKEINFIIEDINYSKKDKDTVHVYDYEDIYSMFLSYINNVNKAFDNLHEICNLSETPSLYEPSLDFYENEFISLKAKIIKKITTIKPINCLS
jgi:hypothetical protein